MIPRRIHEWAADRFSFVQYPQLRRAPVTWDGLIDRAFKWGLLAWLMWLIWGGFFFFVVVALITFL